MSDYTNKGVIFKNNYKQSDKHPDYKGKINVDGIEKEIALYVNSDKNGKKYFGVVISEPYIKPDQPKETPLPESESKEDDLDNLPF